MESLHQNDEVESVTPMSDRPQWREWAKEEIVRNRAAVITGSVKGERFVHRGWPLEVLIAFLAAPVIRPAKGEIQRRLYGR